MAEGAPSEPQAPPAPVAWTAEGVARLVAAVPLPVVVTEVEDPGRLLFANEPAFELFEVSPDDATAVRGRDYYADPADRGRVMEALARQGVIRDMEVLLRTARGRRFWGLVSGRRIMHEGRPVAVISMRDITERRWARETIEDLLARLQRANAELEVEVAARTSELRGEVTERHRTEDALRQREQLLKDVLDTSSDWLWETGPDHRFTGFSPRMAETLGLAPENFIGRSRVDLSAENVGDPKWQAHVRILERREPFRDFTYEIRLPDGQTRHLRISGVPVFGRSGEFLGYRGIAADVSAAARQQQELERATGVLESTLSSMDQGVAVFDANVVMVAANQRFGELYQLPPELVQVGRTTLGDIVRHSVALGAYGPVDPDALVRERLQHVASGALHRFERQLPDGKWVQVNRNPLPSGGVVITVTDVTALKEAERGERRARKEATRARRQLVEAIEAINEGFILCDSEDRVVLFNRRYREEFALDPDVLKPGTRFEDIIRAGAHRGRHPRGYAPEEFVRERMERHRNPSTPFVLQRADGRWELITEYRTSDGGIVGIRTDVTGLKQRELELEESRRLLRAVIDAVPGIINVKDRLSRYVLMNRFQGEVYGTDPDAAIGRTSADFTGPVYGEASRQLDLQVIESGLAQPFQERRFTDRNGVRRTWFTAKLPLKDAAGKVLNVVTVALDITKLKATERARSNLARYFAPSMVDVLAASDEPFGPARTQDVAVLFADIIGFTGLCAVEPAGEVFALLREFHSRLAAEVFACGGTIDKYIGDALMATFGTPDAGPDDAARALACAFAMQRTMEAWTKERRRTGLPAIRVGIGVHYGPVLLGNVGTERRLEFAVIGDTVNVASRLERLTRPLKAGIVASDAVVDAARRMGGEAAEARIARMTWRGAQPIRGRGRGLDVWMLPLEPLPRRRRAGVR